VHLAERIDERRWVRFRFEERERQRFLRRLGERLV
jgi:hypothetical protein